MKGTFVAAALVVLLTVSAFVAVKTYDFIKHVQEAQAAQIERVLSGQ